jgi:hypothetical protein
MDLTSYMINISQADDRLTNAGHLFVKEFFIIIS